MAMKDKMELTIGICVGSSIVWCIFSRLCLLLTPNDFATANCHICRTPPCGDWLDVSTCVSSGLVS
jgi:hypothetical protein